MLKKYKKLIDVSHNIIQLILQLNRDERLRHFVNTIVKLADNSYNDPQLGEIIDELSQISNVVNYYEDPYKRLTIALDSDLECVMLAGACCTHKKLIYNLDISPINKDILFTHYLDYYWHLNFILKYDELHDVLQDIKYTTHELNNLVELSLDDALAKVSELGDLVREYFEIESK